MIRRLAADTAPAPVEADVVVIGAGIAGMIVAVELAQAGKRVVVLESGLERQDGETHPLNEVEQTGDAYAGAMHGRARCLGGTSTLWGGAMVPLLDADFAGEDHQGWPVSPREFMRFVPEVERMFALPDDAYERPDIGDVGSDAAFVPRLAKWPPFRQRNVANLFETKVRSTGPDIWLDATVTDFRFRDDGQLDQLIATSLDGTRLAVRAGQFVCAAGAIESTRLLLLADHQADKRVFSPDSVLGRYFHDHLSVPVARVEPSSPRRFNRVFGFRFQGANMRNLRFEPSGRSDVRAEVVPGFAHIGFSEVEGGFAALRDALRRLQQRRLPQAETIARLATGAPWLARAVWWRLVEKRLLAPAGAEMLVHAVIEQEPRADNRITLGSSHDSFGQPRAAIHWEVNTGDEARLTAFSDAFERFWNDTPLRDLGRMVRRPKGEAERELPLGGGIYHPCGSTRMGRSAADGVVDADLACFRVPNLAVLATSAFPRAGGANPTMTLMAAAIRLARRLG